MLVTMRVGPVKHHLNVDLFWNFDLQLRCMDAGYHAQLTVAKFQRSNPIGSQLSQI